MMINKWRQLVVLALLLCGVAYAADNSDQVYTDDKSSITVTSSHPQFVIKLKSNPTTGFKWYLREYNSKMITPVKHNYQVPNSKMIGASGFELWTFRMKPEAFTVPQMFVIRLVYTRPWNSTDSSTQALFRVATQKD